MKPIKSDMKAVIASMMAVAGIDASALGVTLNRPILPLSQSDIEAIESAASRRERKREKRRKQWAKDVR